MIKKYLAELIGTFTLSFVVLLSILTGSSPIAIPVIAGLTLVLFVYTIGPISGCHINPSVTIGLYSVNKISRRDALFYIIAQVIGAFVAILIISTFKLSIPVSAGVTSFSWKLFTAEMLGAIIFNFGIGSVVFGRAKEQMSGVIIGGSLLLGIIISVLAGAAGILNPAVALALNSLTYVYLFGPIIGAVIGIQLYKYISSSR